jgi:hypothetical protein
MRKINADEKRTKFAYGHGPRLRMADLRSAAGICQI